MDATTIRKPTTAEMVSVWWLVSWRKGMLEFLALLALGGVFKVMSNAGWMKPEAGAWVCVAMFVLQPLITFLVIRMAFRKKYYEFRIGVVSAPPGWRGDVERAASLRADLEGNVAHA